PCRCRLQPDPRNRRRLAAVRQSPATARAWPRGRGGGWRLGSPVELVQGKFLSAATACAGHVSPAAQDARRCNRNGCVAEHTPVFRNTSSRQGGDADGVINSNTAKADGGRENV